MKITRHSWPWWRWFITGLNILALVLSVSMSWHFLTGRTMAGCGGGSPCEQVLNSRWSVIAGILPVSGLAVGVYLAILAASFFTGRTNEAPIRRLAWNGMLILAGSVAGSAIWFTIVQKWIIGEFCPYCMTTHIAGLLLAALVIWRATTESDYDSSQRLIRPLRAMGKVIIGLVMAGILIAGQISFAPSSVYSKGESQDKIPTIDYNTVPLIGPVDAPYKVTLLFDYQCSHCQQLHFMLNEAVNHYSGKLSFVLCPAPLNTECNPYIPRDAPEFRNSCELAKIALAVWVADRDKYDDFENWMFTFESGDRWRPRSPEAARAKAIEMVGMAGFGTALSDPWIGQYLQTSVRIYSQTIRNGTGGIPKLIFGSGWIIPEPYNADDLVMILQKSLGVPKP